MPAIDRRSFLGAVGLIGASGLGAHHLRNGDALRHSSVSVALPGGMSAPGARWLMAENARAGTLDWVVHRNAPTGTLEGYLDHTNATVGSTVAMYVSTTAAHFSAAVYRMGFYGGLGGRFITRTPLLHGGVQSAPTKNSLNMIECHWKPSWHFKIDRTWPPGCYLIKLTSSTGNEQYIPLTISDLTSHAAFFFSNSVTTWQAYNSWGGYSLYNGPGGLGETTRSDRARQVSFDRPYDRTLGAGSGDFFGNEFPVLFQMESLGLDLAYGNDLSFHQNPLILQKHRCLLSLGHDEYWSYQMRYGVERAIATGTNVALLGANFCFRQIRVGPSALGANRRIINYKSSTEDPITPTHPELSTTNWPSPPLNRPESLFSGSEYVSINANDPLRVVNATGWLWKGTGAREGQLLPGVVVGEYNRFMPGFRGPQRVDLFGHSVVRAQNNHADITYYSHPTGGGVLSTGTASWIVSMSNSSKIPPVLLRYPVAGVTSILLRAMENLYGVFGSGPASITHPSSGNWRRYEG